MKTRRSVRKGLVPGGRLRARWTAAAAAVLCLAAFAPARADAGEFAWTLVTKTSPPATMHPGEKYPVAVVVTNTGTATWFADNLGMAPVIRLGASSPRNRSSAFASDDPSWLWSGGTRVRMTTPVVPPGADAVFAFTFTAPALPSYPATFDEHFAPVAEGIEWMDSHDVNFTTTVKPVAGAVPPVPNPPLPDPFGIGLPCLPTFAGTPDYRDVLPPAVALMYGGGTAVAPGVLSVPGAIAFDSLGREVVADTGNDRIVRMDANGFVLFSWGTHGTATKQFDHPSGVAVTAGGQVYVADTGNNRVQMFTLSGVPLAQFGTAGSGPGEFSAPGGVAVIPSGPMAGNIAVADTGNDRVQILSQFGAFVAQIGTSGAGPGQLDGPSSVAVYGNQLWVSDTGNDRVERFSLDGTFLGAFGGAGDADGCMSAPAGIVANVYGAYVVDAGHSRIQHFTRNGVILESWGTAGAATGQLGSPAGIAVVGGGSVWVTERSNNRLQHFEPGIAAAPAIPCGNDPLACASPPPPPI